MELQFEPKKGKRAGIGFFFFFFFFLNVGLFFVLFWQHGRVERQGTANPFPP